MVGNTTAGPVRWDVDCLSSTLASTGPVSLVPPNKTAYGAALAINDAGDACGRNTALAFRSLAGGVFQELSTPRGASSKALDINDSRQVVGQVFDPGKGTFAALWQADGSRVDLNSFLGRTSAWERIWWGTSITANGAIGAIGAKKGTAGNESSRPAHDREIGTPHHEARLRQSWVRMLFTRFPLDRHVNGPVVGGKTGGCGSPKRR